VHCLDSGFTQITHADLGGCPADNGIIDNHDPFAAQNIFKEVKFYAHAQVARILRRLDKSPAYVMIPDDPHLQRYS